MLMDLVFDIGNTRTKWASFINGAMVEHGIFQNDHPLPSSLIELDANSNVLVCSVSNDTVASLAIRNKFQTILEFDTKTPIPVRSEYKSQATLGLDRLANAVAAHREFSGHDALIIDAGTCITIDLISSTGVFMGGTIAPGLQMRLLALNNYTDGLPLVQLAEAEHHTGRTTEQSILSGVINGSIAELNGWIAHYQEGYPRLKVIVTGGDLVWFEHVLKSKTFADAFFTLRGLHAILQHNSTGA